MLRYTTDRARPGLVALYDIQPGNGVGQFLQPRSPHGAINHNFLQISTASNKSTVNEHTTPVATPTPAVINYIQQTAIQSNVTRIKLPVA